MIPRTALAALLALAAALAGCTGGEDAPAPTTSTPATSTPATSTPGGTPTPATPTPPGPGEAPAFTLTTPDVPTLVFAGEEFTFNLTIEGNDTRETDHVGAHFDVNATPDPQGPYGQPCPHDVGTVPGNFTVTCRFATAGTYHLRGHLRINESGTLHNYWADEVRIVARPPVANLTIEVTDAPQLPVLAGSTFNFTMRVTGDRNETSDHVGGHFGPNSTDEPTVPAYPRPCEHVAADVPGNGTFVVSCAVPAGTAPGPQYLRGHVRVTVADREFNFWSDEVPFIVAL